MSSPHRYRRRLYTEHTCDVCGQGKDAPQHTTPTEEEALQKATDTLLAYSGTPRAELFEYPHRDDDSRAMIQKARQTALELRTLFQQQ